jgi:exopolysaccharide biosynthesis polyprenyl glycosylphosphotransferase
MMPQRQSQTFLLVEADIVAVYLSLTLAYYTRVWWGQVFSLIPLTYGLSFYLWKWWFVLVILVTIAYYGGYGITVNVWDDLLVIIRSLFVSFLVTWMILSLQKEAEAASRIVVTLSFVYMLIIMTALRFFLKLLLYRVLDWRRESCLLGSRDERERQLIASLNNEWYSGYKIVRQIDRNENVGALDVCFVPIWQADEDTVKNVKAVARKLILIADISGLSFMDTEIKTFLSENIGLITSSNGLLSPQKVAFKRAFDVMFSLFCTIVFSPIFLLIAVAIKFDSKGAVFFRHKRCGKAMSEFYMLKFRTMRPNGDEILKEYLEQNPEARRDLVERNKLKNDPRITRIGKILRKTSLDELPQLINVIKGEMSVVGPRPDTTEAVKNFYHDYKGIYAKVKPGITGLWQVSGRSEIDYQKRVRIDYLYVLNWSLWLDVVIILKTFKTILSGKGAY